MNIIEELDLVSFNAHQINLLAKILKVAEDNDIVENTLEGEEDYFVYQTIKKHLEEK